MGIFGDSRGGNPSLNETKITFENLCSQLNSPIYADGIDRDTMVTLLGDMYKWIVVNPNTILRLPAPSNNVDDKYRIMYAEGAKITSRSKRESQPLVAKQYASLSRKYTASNPSTVSTTRSTKYVGFVEDDDHHSSVRSSRHPSGPKRHSSKSKSTYTVPVSKFAGMSMEPSKSTERLFPIQNNEELNDDDDGSANYVRAPAPIRPRSTKSRQPTNVGFADD